MNFALTPADSLIWIGLKNARSYPNLIFFSIFIGLNACQVRFVGAVKSEAHLRIFVAELMGRGKRGGGTQTQAPKLHIQARPGQANTKQRSTEFVK